MKFDIDLLNELMVEDTNAVGDHILKLTEEVGEVADAHLSLSGFNSVSKQLNTTVEDLTGELGDVMNVLYTIGVCYGISPDDIVQAANRGLLKWKKSNEVKKDLTRNK